VSQDDLYREATAAYGAALDRLVRAYEADPDKRRDLLQEIHFLLVSIVVLIVPVVIGSLQKLGA